MPPTSVVFIHGMFVTPSCWKNWESHFRARGYRTLAPAWPEHEPPAAAQRARHPNPKLAELTLERLVEHHRAVVRELPDKPILVGHSMGGLIVQLLLQEDLGAVGVAIDSAPPKGVVTLAWSFLKSNWPAINPFASANEPIYLDEDAFHYAFTNTLSREQSRAAWDSEVVPESRRVGKGPTTGAAKIDFSRARAPLLMIAGEKDHIIPAGLVGKNFARYGQAAPTELKTFGGRDHFLIGSEGWLEIADFVLDWLKKDR